MTVVGNLKIIVTHPSICPWKVIERDDPLSITCSEYPNIFGMHSPNEICDFKSDFLCFQIAFSERPYIPPFFYPLKECASFITGIRIFR